MRVLHLNAGNLFGGIESYLLTLARYRHLAPNMEPYFGLCFSGRLRDELKASGVPVYDLGAVRLSRPWTVLRARRRLKSLLRTLRFDAVVTHSCWPHAAFAPTVKSIGVRLINAVHGDLSHPNWLDRWAARTAPDLVIANSRFTATPAAKLFQGSPLEVLYLPVPSMTFEDPGEVRQQVRESLGTPAGTTVILQASRLERWKGQAIHLDALAQLKQVPGWEAWFAGGAQRPSETEYQAELTETAQRVGIAERVRFLGQRSDVPRLMAAADLFCQPNTGPEPFGIVFIEALHAGLPIVTSGFGGATEIVDEASGVLTDPGDPTAVAGALEKLIRNPARRQVLSEGGPSRAAELCDPQARLGQLALALRGRLETDLFLDSGERLPSPHEYHRTDAILE